MLIPFVKIASRYPAKTLSSRAVDYSSISCRFLCIMKRQVNDSLCRTRCSVHSQKFRNNIQQLAIRNHIKKFFYLSFMFLLFSACSTGLGRPGEGVSPENIGTPETPFTIKDKSQLIGGPLRSEERRVGKECRSRG